MSNAVLMITQIAIDSLANQNVCPECRIVDVVTVPWPFLDLLPDFIFLFREGMCGTSEEGEESGRWGGITESKWDSTSRSVNMCTVVVRGCVW